MTIFKENTTWNRQTLLKRTQLKLLKKNDKMDFIKIKNVYSSENNTVKEN